MNRWVHFARFARRISSIIMSSWSSITRKYSRLIICVFNFSSWSSPTSALRRNPLAPSKKEMPVEEVVIEDWSVIPCPPEVTLSAIHKEKGTHGAVYLLYECDMSSPIWVGQSVPAIVKAVNDKSILAIEKRLHASSLYRCLRGESKKGIHKGWRVERVERGEIASINERIKKFSSVVFVSKDPEKWRTDNVLRTSESASDASAEAHADSNVQDS